MAFDVDVRARLAAMEVTPSTAELARDLAPGAAERIRPALQAYYSRWRDLPGYNPALEGRDRQLAEEQAAFIEALLAGQMDEDYRVRLDRLFALETVTGFGVRVHLGAAAQALIVLFEEIGRRRRWSGRGAAADCAALLRYVMVDCLNTFQLERVILEKGVAARKATIGDALGSFGEAASHLRSVMGDASHTLAQTSREATRTLDAAADAAARTGEAADRGSENLVSTAGASAQLVQSISEIDQLANRSLDAVRRTTVSVGSLDAEIGQLERAAGAIGGVVSLIAGIAAQTNLLALNATIEAARAGEAGRGFSVVAAEVKSLAGQTAEATREITAQVAAIQAAAGRSAGQLGAIVEVVAGVEEIASAAATATSEQALATASIADQAQAAAEAVRTIRAAADGLRGFMEELRLAAGAMAAASETLSGHGIRFDEELGRLSQRLTAA